MSEPAWVPIGGALQDVGAEVAYQEFTANVAVSATSEAASNAVVTAPAFTADGSSQYLVEFSAPSAVPPQIANAYIVITLYLDGVAAGQLGVLQNGSAVVIGTPLRFTRRVTPAAGARTYSVRAWCSSGSGAVNAGAGGAGTNFPGFIRITKVPSAAPGMYGLVPPTAIGTVLPASPVDGQEFILTDSLTAPTYSWRLRYVAAKASNKWVFVGGTDYYAVVAGAETVGTGSTWVDLATVGPRLIVPYAGDYQAVGAAQVWPTTAAAVLAQLGVSAGATAPGMPVAVQSAAAALSYLSVVTQQRLLAVAAGSDVRLRYYGTTTTSFANRSLLVQPVAIGG